MKNVAEFLRTIEFINVATADTKAKPNVAPKFLLKAESGCIYLVDHVMGRTWENLKVNPRVSLSAIDMDSLIGYRINGKAEIIEKGELYDRLLEELRAKEVRLSAKRVINGVSRLKRNKSLEVVFPERFAIFKISIEDILKICPTGKLQKERL